MEADSQNKTDVITKTNIWLPPVTRRYISSVHFENSPREVASFVRKQTYHVKISINCTANDLLTVARLLDMIAGLNLIDKDFPPVA